MDHRTGRDTDGVTGLIVMAALLAVLLVQLGRMITVGGVFSDGLFVDGDVYMWLNRVEALAEGRGWFDHHEPRVFPPEGHEQHWTRPLDFLLFVGGWVLSPVFGFRDGLALWANAIAPVAMVVAAWALYRTARYLLDRRQAAMAVAVFAVHPMILLTFAWGRADHHALLRLGQVLFLLAFVSFFLGDRNRLRRAFVAGWIGAWAVWVNIEALAFVLIAMALLGLWWLVGRREFVTSNVALGAGLFAGMVAAVGIERGPAFFADLPIDTIGFPYVVLFGLTWLFWVGLWLWTRYGPETGWPGRAAVAAALTALVLGALAAVEPTFFAGPFGQVDEVYRQVRLELLGEQLPALRFGEQPAVALVGRTLSLYGILLVGLWGFWRGIKTADGPRQRWIWTMLAIMALGYGALSLDTVRWSAYLPAAAGFGYAVVAVRCIDWMHSTVPAKLIGAVRPPVIIVLVVGLPLIGAGLQQWPDGTDDPQPGEEAVVSSGSCDLRAAARQLETHRRVQSQETIAISPDRSAELLYRTDHSVIAIANHRYQPGFTLFYEAMTDDSFSDARQKLAGHNVGLVMVCNAEIWPTLRDDGNTVIERLARGEYGQGFRLLVKPEDAGGWQIYRVKKE